jgi:hypothetical protein
LELAKAILNHGFDVNLKDNLSLTSLHYAVNNGNLCTVEFLVSNSADLSAQDKSGKTPLQLAEELKVKRDYSLYKRKEIAALLANAHSNKQYGHKPLTIISTAQSSREKSGNSKLNNIEVDNVGIIQKLDLSEVGDYQKVNSKLQHDPTALGKYDKLQNLQFNSQYAIHLATSYMHKPADIVDKLENVAVSYNTETQLPQVHDNDYQASTALKSQETNEWLNLIQVHLTGAKCLQDEIIGNRIPNRFAIEDSFTQSSYSELQATDINSSTTDDDSQIKITVDSKIVSNKQ